MTSLDGKCVTYEQRYAHCQNIRSVFSNSSGDALVSFFERVYIKMMSQENAFKTAVTEVVLLRMHKKDWPDDFWLSVCAMVIEASGVAHSSATSSSPTHPRRHVFLYTLDGHEASVPPEFRPFVRVHPETELRRIFFLLPYDWKDSAGGYLHGDIACGLFMKMNPQYSWAWLIEADVRFAGNWDRFFRESLRAAAGAKNYVPTTPNNGAGDRGTPAHLIWYYPRMLNYGKGFSRLDPQDDHRVNKQRWLRNLHAQWAREAQQAPVPTDPAREIRNVHGWARSMYFLGRWRAMFNDTMWASAFVPAVGVSRRLALLAYKTYLRLDGNMNQEATLPLVAQLFGLKIVSLAGFKQFPSQFYFAFNRKDGECVNNQTGAAGVDGNVQQQPTKKRKCRGESAPLYMNWLRGEVVSSYAANFYGLHTQHFSGGSCLTEVLFHPVKL
jgi:hypothetical protein